MMWLRCLGRLLRVWPLLPLAVAAPLTAGRADSPAGAVAAQSRVAAPRLFADSRMIGHDRFSVEVVGNGPDVILIPGLATSREVWRDLAVGLRQRYRLHLIQVAGFGGQPAGANAEGPLLAPLADALAAYAAALGPAEPSVIGHGMGGAISLMMAHRRPQALGALLLVEALPFAGILYSPDPNSEGVEPAVRTYGDRLLALSAADFERTEKAAFARLVKDDDGARLLLRDAMSSNRAVMVRGLVEGLTIDLRPMMAEIHQPITVIYSWDRLTNRSLEFTDAVYAESYATAPNKALVRIDDALHFVMLDQPGKFEQEVLDFLSHPPPAPGAANSGATVGGEAVSEQAVP